MVTSNKFPDKKVVKMTEPKDIVVVPQRTLLGEVNEHITCPLCRGYYIDATTIVECLHSFCRSCIIKHLQIKSYCPVCEMMINSAKPNIKLDKALQDIVYKLVPGLFQKEMERRQHFYASRPGPAATATPEQRGEDTERIIFSPEDVISFSLEYADSTDADSISSKSSDSNEPQPTSATSRRFLQCPAVVNISHLKKFLSMKFDIDSTQFAIDVLYKRVPLPDYYTLMDIAYIYNWKRNEPMRFFYQIIDYIAIRNRLFDINRKSSHFRDRKPSPASTEDTNISSPAPNLPDNVSEASSGTNSPMPEDNNIKQRSETTVKNEKSKSDCHDQNACEVKSPNKDNISTVSKKPDEDVEKSQFLNSFELTAKSNSTSLNSSPEKSNDNTTSDNDTLSKTKDADSLKRKQQSPGGYSSDTKKAKVDNLEGTKLHSPSKVIKDTIPNLSTNSKESPGKNINPLSKHSQAFTSVNMSSLTPTPSKDLKPTTSMKPTEAVMKRNVSQTMTSKRKTLDAFLTVQASPLPITQSLMSTTTPTSPVPKQSTASTSQPKTVSPLKIQIPKLDNSSSILKPETSKPQIKRIPDLKPSMPQLQSNKVPINKVRMDLLANNCDPTMDRSKILSQVASLNNTQNPGQSSSGDQLKSLFGTINIPSSLSITLTDQKLDQRAPGEQLVIEHKKNLVNKTPTGASNITQKMPIPPPHNYIEILKLPDTDSKKVDGNGDGKVLSGSKPEHSLAQPKAQGKSSETSAKGPVPNLNPIADTKHAKQSGNKESKYVSPITFQQTFEKQVQSMQSDKKPKSTKPKTQVPKLVPATPKAFNAANKANITNKSNPSSAPVEAKTSTALDLTTPHIQNQKAFETMQSIANLAKKQSLPPKTLPQAVTVPQSNVYSNIPNRSLPTTSNPLRVPSSSPSSINTPNKYDKGNPITTLASNIPNKSNLSKPTNSGRATITSPVYQIPSNNSPVPAQPSPRSQTRSPSSSPKLVIAEDKQTVSSTPEQNINQSNQITSTQISNLIAPKNELPKASPGPSKPQLKLSKPPTPTTKGPGVRQPITPTLKKAPLPVNEYYQPQLIMSQEAIFRQRMQWLTAQRQYDLLKNMSNMTQQAQNDHNNKDKK